MNSPTFVCEVNMPTASSVYCARFSPTLVRRVSAADGQRVFRKRGKSHLLEDALSPVARYAVPRRCHGGAIVPKLPDEIRCASEGTRLLENDGGLLAACGSLPSGTPIVFRLTILGVIFRAPVFLNNIRPRSSAYGLHSEVSTIESKKSVEKEARI